jgi:hypothetical protein
MSVFVVVWKGKQSVRTEQCNLEGKREIMIYVNRNSAECLDSFLSWFVAADCCNEIENIRLSKQDIKSLRTRFMQFEMFFFFFIISLQPYNLRVFRCVGFKVI